MDRLGVSHDPYSLLIQDDYPYSVCPNFITPQTELVTAWYVMHTQPKPDHLSVYQHYVRCCETLGVPGVVEALDRMIVVDYLIANEDRHQNNFGLVRDAETLEWIGPAPIYDSGSSLWFSKPQALIRADEPLTCKPFKLNHQEQIQLVSSFDWLDLSALTGIEEEVRDIFRGSLFVDEARCETICRALRQRIKDLASLIASPKTFGIDDRSGDVEKNVAYSGGQSTDDECEH